MWSRGEAGMMAQWVCGGHALLVGVHPESPRLRICRT